MHQYLYSPLSQRDSIRLLRLRPKNEDPKNLRCELFEYSLRNSDYSFHPYEAVSYVWGSENKPQSIVIDDQNLRITQNLHTLLLRLQSHSLSRVIWVDAVCINQADGKEKGHQIPFMAEIYAKASRVLVWLGEAEDDGDEALKAIRCAGESSQKYRSHAELYREQILKLLQRLWFQRIWVLQEVAAARHILIMCGSIEIDGHAFCLGLDSLGTFLEESMIQVTFLIRGAIFRPRETLRDQKRLSLDICSLGELVDMYHSYKATKLHDKLYALLGMCSDDLETAGLEPNYDLGWKELMHRLVKFILGDHVSVDTFKDKEMAFIKSKGCILGKVSQAESNRELGGQKVEVIFTNTKQSGFVTDDGVYWTLPKSAISVQEGDLICLLQGASKPTIIRLHDDHFVIIMIATIPSGYMKRDMNARKLEISQSVSLTRDFSLVWNWELASGEKLDPGNYDSLMRTSNWGMLETGLASQMRNVRRIWGVAQTLQDIGEDEKAWEVLHKAVKSYGIALGQESSQIPNIQDYIPLSLWAARNGHEDVVRLLLDTGEAEVNLKDTSGRTALYEAAAYGHEAVVKLLLEAKAEVDLKDTCGHTALYEAAVYGQEAVVKLLLQAKAEVDLKDGFSQTPLHRAAENGHEAVVKLLLQAKAKVDLKDRSRRTPLHKAAEWGHEAVVKLLQSPR